VLFRDVIDIDRGGKERAIDHLGNFVIEGEDAVSI
jgi:hypothetical protein